MSTQSIRPDATDQAERRRDNLLSSARLLPDEKPADALARATRPVRCHHPVQSWHARRGGTPQPYFIAVVS
jgi:hypothetical protein